ncbi:protein of unknown function [Bradyrhizobium vignae]|uniref:Uncharacterized protein n=1 Tax=Bradyrhizobium vignae TaxID=1549949 RepID=A0A2U3Q432_9BRAD|nr:protein of unknown function [Bradyrhizobium vignae]
MSTSVARIDGVLWSEWSHPIRPLRARPVHAEITEVSLQTRCREHALRAYSEKERQDVSLGRERSKNKQRCSQKGWTAKISAAI